MLNIPAVVLEIAPFYLQNLAASKQTIKHMVIVIRYLHLYLAV